MSKRKETELQGRGVRGKPSQGGADANEGILGIVSHGGEISDQREGDRKMQGFLLFVGMSEREIKGFCSFYKTGFSQKKSNPRIRGSSIHYPNPEVVRFNCKTHDLDHKLPSGDLN